MPRRVSVLVAVTALAFAAACGGGDSEEGTGAADPSAAGTAGQSAAAAKDVEVTGCDTKDGPFPTVKLEVTNSLPEPADYSITIDIQDKNGEKQAEAIAYVEGAEPGKKEKAEAPGGKEVDGDIQCKVASADRIQVPEE